jgi:hypothetical protein
MDQRTRRQRAIDLIAQLTLEQAGNILEARRNPQAEINLNFLKGDHWQNGNGWVGPGAAWSTDQLGAAVYAAIKESFVSRNVIAEITQRHVAGVLGRQPHWKFAVSRVLEDVEVVDEVTGETRIEKGLPTDEEQALINEAEAALVSWWDDRNVNEILQTCLTSALNTKRGVLRLYVPDDLRDEDGHLPPGDLSQTIQYIWLQHLGHNDDKLEIEVPTATVYIHTRSRRHIGLFLYEDADTLLDAVLSGGQSSSQHCEITYINQEGLTVLRVIDSAGDLDDAVVMPLGGRLTMYELTRSWLVTPQIVSQQKLVNLAMTMKQRNAVLGGFLERIFTNVQWPGEDKIIDGKKVFVPAPIPVGAGVMTHLMGLMDTDEEGRQSRATPGVNYRDPVSPATFIETENSAYTAILQEANQLHYLTAGDSGDSGESRKQAREAFRQDLELSAGKIADMVRWLLETVLAEASFFAGRPNAFAGLRVYVEARISSGPVAADDMRVAVEMKDAELWSTELAMSATGIDDVDAEKQRIAQERAERAPEEPSSEATPPPTETPVEEEEEVAEIAESEQ